MEIDSRPSDALALAVRSGAPIFAAEEVIAESAIEFEHEVEDTEEVVDRFKEFLDEVIARGLRRGSEVPDGATPAAASRQRQVEDPLDELVEVDAGGVGRLRQQARLGQARARC